VIHRDFQCQNIMIHDGIPRFIDYQGARMAPPAYDVASVLWDPYYRLDDGVRERLLGYYVSEMASNAARAFDAKSFMESLILCRLQRHMQALGAYGFLSAVKGKKYFLKHVPEALRLLKAEAVEVRRQYPELARLVAKLWAGGNPCFPSRVPRGGARRRRPAPRTAAARRDRSRPALPDATAPRA